jgi:hypothetical protein
MKYIKPDKEIEEDTRRWNPPSYGHGSAYKCLSYRKQSSYSM